MNQKEFLEELSQTRTNYKWQIVPYQGLRGVIKRGKHKGYACCPIAALYRQKTGKFETNGAPYEEHVRESLSLHTNTRDKIVRAADIVVECPWYNPPKHVKNFRKAMERAVGLKGTK